MSDLVFTEDDATPTPPAGTASIYAKTDGLFYTKDDAGAETPLRGDTGLTGDTGATGPGVAIGGTTDQMLVKASGTNYDTEWTTLQGTTNQVTVTHGVGTITIAAPQDLHTGASPTFAGVTAPLTGDVTGNVTGNLTGDVTGDVTGNVTGAVTGNVTGNLTGDVTGNLTGDVTGNVTGSAATITGNLTGDVTSTGMTTAIASGVIVNDDINASAAIVDTKLATIATAGKVSNSATTAASANTASAIVARDASGNFSAGTITASLTGNASGTAANITGTVAIANGGTGQTAQTAAFDALAPSTTKGDVIVHDGTDNVRLGVGANDTVLTADSAAASGTKWAAVPGGFTVVSKATADSPYTASASEIILFNATAGAATINLPAAASNTNKQIIIKKTDSSAYVITIDGNASETIDGSTTRLLHTERETYTIVSDGSNWSVLEHKTDTDAQLYTATFTGLGTPSSQAVYSWRDKDRLFVQGYVTAGTPTAALMSMTLGHSGVNGNVTVAVGAKVTATTVVGGGSVGAVPSATYFNGLTVLSDTSATNLVKFGVQTSGASSMTPQNGNAITGAGAVISFNFSVPISGWTGW